MREEGRSTMKNKKRKRKPNEPQSDSQGGKGNGGLTEREQGGSEKEEYFDEVTGASQASFEAAKGARPGTPPEPGGPPRYKDLTVEPEELGVRFLEEATQKPQPELEEREENPEERLNEEERREEGFLITEE